MLEYRFRKRHEPVGNASGAYLSEMKPLQKEYPKAPCKPKSSKKGAHICCICSRFPGPKCQCTRFKLTLITCGIFLYTFKVFSAQISKNSQEYCYDYPKFVVVEQTTFVEY